ncbi:hypothetical protein EJ05DRAFT_203459 [Pseudovirgaria hyperparasitica]|uniref:Uncharacterized protein n=1 Tax=Pseudovirgaria hyperparasitica TaxID=470096 RepID=A0A6A6WHI8_9PEZI|nr:uncharacterized protein EJ05DRAFT_203459 [Pseudovirgaria hyperparasitica]KAF2762258.1 hypothetical protein EJ05DRAFT_203459 [Pseudovirgaria hyperparasitica]
MYACCHSPIYTSSCLLRSLSHLDRQTHRHTNSQTFVTHRTTNRQPAFHFLLFNQKPHQRNQTTNQTPTTKNAPLNPPRPPPHPRHHNNSLLPRRHKLLPRRHPLPLRGPRPILHPLPQPRHDPSPQRPVIHCTLLPPQRPFIRRIHCRKHHIHHPIHHPISTLLVRPRYPVLYSSNPGAILLRPGWEYDGVDYPYAACDWVVWVCGGWE